MKTEKPSNIVRPSPPPPPPPPQPQPPQGKEENSILAAILFLLLCKERKGDCYE